MVIAGGFPPEIGPIGLVSVQSGRWHPSDRDIAVSAVQRVASLPPGAAQMIQIGMPRLLENCQLPHKEAGTADGRIGGLDSFTAVFVYLPDVDVSVPHYSA